MKLRNKFLIIFLFISIIPVIIITAFTYDRYTRLVESQTSQMADNIFEKAEVEANATIANIKHISEIFNFYSEQENSIIEDLKKYTSNHYTSYDILQSNQNISYICKNFIFSFDYINGIFIFTPDGPVLGYGYGNGISIHPSYLPNNDKWYQETLALKGGYYINGISEKDFILNTSPSISFSQALYDVYTHEFLGVLFIDCNPEVFDLSNVNTLPDIAMLAVENQFGHILYSNVNSLKTELTPKNAHVQSTSLDMEGLRLIFAVNYNDLYKDFQFTRTMILAIAIICSLVFFIISVFLSHSITRPITHLSRKMAMRIGQNLETTPKYLERTDEIGILYNEYNRMLETQQKYIENELQSKLITLDSQMKSLEAQINSHFLFNTLESINSIAELEEVESIATMSLALGNMFRYSIKTQSELVTISDELKHVNDYIAIQKIRFEGRFELILNIPPEAYSLKVLKLILQPIVENAFYHGLKYCTCGSCITISLISERENKLIYIDISDDGVGMTEEQLVKLQNRLREKAEFTELGHRNKQSIGLSNIHTRISLYYGEGYGLQIKSMEGIGTTVRIKLPLLQTGKEHVDICTPM